VETDYASGCVFFVNTDVFNKIGFFNERFYLTYEETDFCYRARRAGIKSYFVPNAKVWHKVSISFGGEGSAVFIYFRTRNKLLWAEKNLDFVKRLEVYIYAIYEFLYNIFPPRVYLKFDGNKSLFRTIYQSMLDYKICCIEKYKDPKGKAYRWGLRDYFLRRFGDCPDSVRSLNK
jgi:GT2 family glycosyltransferase